MVETRPVIIGSGIAGLSAALAMAPLPVVVLTRRLICESSSSLLAQGGIAAAVGANDHSELHELDTLAAGAGLCDPEIVRLVTSAAPQTIKQLCEWGVKFDLDKNGEFDLGLEGAHCRRRIVHSEGDRTGASIMRALAARVRETPSIKIIENATVTELLKSEGRITGVHYSDANGKHQYIASKQILLATGGAGDLWKHTTNPIGAYGRGIALAARAGALLIDMEFMQFHPTAIDVGIDPMPLASEALRGEGAVLINDYGKKFMATEPLCDLSPRDLVTRRIWAQLEQGRKVYLDARKISAFAKHFPAIHDFCAKSGIDPESMPIPVLPAAHYHMGGVAVDNEGRTNVKGLWACGEVSATGLHGANRLASNSLLESLVFGLLAAKSISNDWHATAGDKTFFEESVPILNRWETAEERLTIRSAMSNYVGVLRNEKGLRTAIETLHPIAEHSDMAIVGLIIANAALKREESRGSHFRTDFPVTSDDWKLHKAFLLQDVYETNFAQNTEKFICASFVNGTKTNGIFEKAERGLI